MRFLIDHDVPIEAFRLFQEEGHSAVRLKDVLEITTPDEGVFQYAQEHSFIVLTCNRGRLLEAGGRESACRAHHFDSKEDQAG